MPEPGPLVLQSGALTDSRCSTSSSHCFSSARYAPTPAYASSGEHPSGLCGRSSSGGRPVRLAAGRPVVVDGSVPGCGQKLGPGVARTPPSSTAGARVLVVPRGMTHSISSAVIRRIRNRPAVLALRCLRTRDGDSTAPYGRPSPGCGRRAHRGRARSAGQASHSRERCRPAISWRPRCGWPGRVHTGARRVEDPSGGGIGEHPVPDSRVDAIVRAMSAGTGVSAIMPGRSSSPMRVVMGTVTTTVACLRMIEASSGSDTSTRYRPPVSAASPAEVPLSAVSASAPPPLAPSVVSPSVVADSSTVWVRGRALMRVSNVNRWIIR